MTTSIVPLHPRHTKSVAQFNSRLRAAGATSQFYCLPDADLERLDRSVGLYQEQFLAVDPQEVVRGAYMLKHQRFFINGADRQIADYQLPVSEGIVDQSYNFVGMQLLGDATRRQPNLFALGMGGYGESLPKMLKAARWSMELVPFWFKVLHPNAFLTNLSLLKRTRFRRLSSALAAYSGLGWVGHRLLGYVRRKRRLSPDISVQQPDEFGSWADELWEKHKAEYSMIAVRNRAVLNRLYPSSRSEFIRLRVQRRGQDLGWAVLLATAMCDHKYFGNMKLGSVVDCFAHPRDAGEVVAAADQELRRRGADLIVSNQSHWAWCDGLKSCGYFQGPSNYLFAVSRSLAKDLKPLETSVSNSHLTRGDGDGPIHL